MYEQTLKVIIINNNKKFKKFIIEIIKGKINVYFYN